ncbi:MAG: inorganic phosphate transporter [Fibrobacteres bacterium]|nr:inorganic phosphate transporter [Fibrobacterota bacterium]
MHEIIQILYQHPFVFTIVIFALIFDFLNGFHDAANSIATIVVSKTLTPFQAVVMAGLANFIGYFVFGVAVAKMIGKGVVQIEPGATGNLEVIMATLVGAILWNIATWLLGLPTSSSHALIGGLIGASIVHAGPSVVHWAGVAKIFSFIFIAPMLGLLGASAITTMTIRLFRRAHPAKSRPVFKGLQLVTGVFSSIGHGTNDAQKTMGIIALALYTSGIQSSFEIPKWVILAAYCAISLGTVFGGWRIVKTMGTNITKIREMEGFCSGTAAAAVLLGTAHFGIPVSTTHVITGSIMGVGAVQHAASVKWVSARKIVWAWLITIPITATVAAFTYWVITSLMGL